MFVKRRLPSGEWFSWLALRESAAACHRPEHDLNVVEATGNTIRFVLSFGRISLQSSCDNDATGNGNDRSDCSETIEVLGRF